MKQHVSYKHSRNEVSGRSSCGVYVQRHSEIPGVSRYPMGVRKDREGMVTSYLRIIDGFEKCF